MNTNDKYELPPLPRGDIAADTCPTMWVHTDQQLQDYARAAIEADRKRRSEQRIEWLREVLECAEHVATSDYFGIDAAISKLMSVVERCPQPAEPLGQHPDDAAVDTFAAAMKAKLAKKRADGRGNWQMCTSTYLSRLLREHVEKGDPVDVANLAMMLSLNGQRIVPAEPMVINAIFETCEGEITGTTAAKVKRYELQDDGSITVVIDYWPQPYSPATETTKGNNEH